MPGRSGAVPVTASEPHPRRESGDERNDETERHGLLLGEREKSITSSNTGGVRNCHLASLLCGFPACQRAARVVRQSRGYRSPHSGLAAAHGSSREGALPSGGEGTAAGLRCSHLGAARSQRLAAHGRGAGDRRRGDTPSAPRRRDLSAPLSKDLLPGTVARRSAGGIRAASLGISALPDAAAHRAHDHRVSQLSDPGPILCAPHAVWRGAAREQHREGAEAVAGDGGGVVAARRGGAGAAPHAPGRGPRARRHRAAQHHRVPRTSGADPGRLRSGGPARHDRARRLGRPLRTRSRAAPCARRSICNARSADSQASSASCRGAGSRRCFALPIDFERPSSCRPKSESPHCSSVVGKVPGNTLGHRPDRANLRHLGTVRTDTRTTLQGPLRLIFEAEWRRRTMSGNTARRAAITAATNYKHAGPPLDYKESPATSLFGTNVFGLTTMKATCRRRSSSR